MHVSPCALSLDDGHTARIGHPGLGSYTAASSVPVQAHGEPVTAIMPDTSDCFEFPPLGPALGDPDCGARQPCSTKRVIPTPINCPPLSKPSAQPTSITNRAGQQQHPSPGQRQIQLPPLLSGPSGAPEVGAQPAENATPTIAPPSSPGCAPIPARLNTRIVCPEPAATVRSESVASAGDSASGCASALQLEVPAQAHLALQEQRVLHGVVVHEAGVQHPTTAGSAAAAATRARAMHGGVAKGSMQQPGVIDAAGHDREASFVHGIADLASHPGPLLHRRQLCRC